MNNRTGQAKGRPLRFLAALSITWIAARALFLYTLAVEPAAGRQGQSVAASTEQTRYASVPDSPDVVSAVTAVAGVTAERNATAGSE